LSYKNLYGYMRHPNKNRDDKMATRLKVVDDHSDVANAAPPPAFDPAPTRNRLAGWTADRQRRFIDILNLTGSCSKSSSPVRTLGTFELRCP
ncbi:MAG TPA: hypothetical protein VGR05_05840, partial [Sphingomicrobium sp.]|nr:hypothetical protein [Sphingomicrobium sp.]